MSRNSYGYTKNEEILGFERKISCAQAAGGNRASKGSSRVREILGPKPKAPASDPNTVTLAQPVSVRVTYRVVGLPIGTKLQLMSRDGDHVGVRYDGTDYDIAIAATNLK